MSKLLIIYMINLFCGQNLNVWEPYIHPNQLYLLSKLHTTNMKLILNTENFFLLKSKPSPTSKLATYYME